MALTMLMDNNKNEKLNRNTCRDKHREREKREERKIDTYSYISRREKEGGESGYWCGDKVQKIGIQTNQVASICPCSL